MRVYQDAFKTFIATSAQMCYENKTMSKKNQSLPFISSQRFRNVVVKMRYDAYKTRSVWFITSNETVEACSIFQDVQTRFSLNFSFMPRSK